MFLSLGSRPIDQTLPSLETNDVLTIDDIREIADLLHRRSLGTLGYVRARQPGELLSPAETLAWKNFRPLRIDSTQQDAAQREPFISCAGHAAPIYDVTLAEFSFFPSEVAKTYDDLNLTLHGHPDMHAPSVDVSWGSLRQGLSSDAEMALGPRLRKREFRVCILATGRWPVAGGTSVGGGRDSRCLSLGRPHRKRGLEQDLAQRVHRRGLSHDSCGGQAIRLLPAGVQVQGT